MNRRTSMRRVWSVVAALGVPALMAGCPFDDVIPTSSDDDSTSTGDTTANAPLNDEGHPVGWTEETHSNDVAPNYAVVFPDDEVNRLDITIAPEDWQAMLDDMTAMYGEFGQGGGGGLPSQDGNGGQGGLHRPPPAGGAGHPGTASEKRAENYVFCCRAGCGGAGARCVLQSYRD